MYLRSLYRKVLFSQRAEVLIDEKYATLIEKSELFKNPAESKRLLRANKVLNALYTLKHLKDCINQTVGDAISDLLVVELVLAWRNMSVVDWDAQYTDLPSRQLKVAVKDRNLIKTTDAERRVSEPAQVQAEIDALIARLAFDYARAFVRPSGTEDVVRVYAEADTQANTDELARRVSQIVYDLAGGVGKRP